MKRRALDVRELETHAFGHRDPVWWAVMMSIAIEGTMLVLLAISYFYIRDRTTPFPPEIASRTIGYVGGVGAFLWLVSCWPMHVAAVGAVEKNLRKIRLGLWLSTLLAAGGLACRVIEIDMLPFRWDASAYASTVWALLVAQLLHQITGIIENTFFVVLYQRGPIEEKHRVDVQVSTPLWYFVAAGALLVFAIVYGDILLVEHR